ncbi:hypothetical protein B0T22DRAFT_4181 [Podospora appendiculata]|uniref:Uncharacterized protein n=1 Tax=Podospora appendiculata TaxID=314037 RepID=A0AAE0XEQ6_9PEZI|nr:hypothetical protein B0T22DRAFT_4181 [Podospora appendiculata]
MIMMTFFSFLYQRVFFLLFSGLWCLLSLSLSLSLALALPRILSHLVGDSRKLSSTSPTSIKDRGVLTPVQAPTTHLPVQHSNWIKQNMGHSPRHRHWQHQIFFYNSCLPSSGQGEPVGAQGSQRCRNPFWG